MRQRTLRLFALAAVCLGFAAASPARADRVQVFSIQGAECATCANVIKAQLRKVKGVKKSEFDMHRVEMTVTLDDKVTDERVVQAIAAAGLKSVVGAGAGSYLPAEHYPAGADVFTVTDDGDAVGPL